VSRFDAAVEHLHKHDLPFVVSVAEDATRIVKRVEYDPATNRCVGFVIPLYTAVTTGRCPSFCLGCVGTDNTFTAKSVLKIWIHQTGETPLGFQPTVLDVEDSFTLTEPCADYIKHHITMLVQGQVSLLCI
jgi:hypothetical protein